MDDVTTKAPELEKQEEITTTTPVLEDGKVGPSETVPAAGEDVNYETLYKEKEKAYSESSKEAQRLNEIAKAQETRILKFAMKSRDTFQEYLDEKDLSPEQKETALKLYDEQKSKEAKKTETEEGKEKSVIEQPIEDPYSKRALERLAEDEKKKDEERDAIAKEFLAKEDTKALEEWQLDAIGKLANQFDFKDGLSPREAFNKAVEKVLGKEKVLEAKNEENYINGIKDALIGGVVSATPTSNATPSYSLSNLPKADRDYVQAYIQNKNLNAQEAQNYIKKYTERLNRDN